jgi:hypothetical protein
MRHTPNSRKARQDWQPGEIVNVGFLRGLEVIRKVPTPGDHAPDAYVLWQSNTNRFYRFVPHRGIERHDTLAAAIAA